MGSSFYILGVLAMVITALVLLLGIGSFGKGGAFHAKHANRLMRMRLALQFAAVILLVLYVYLNGQGA